MNLRVQRQEWHDHTAVLLIANHGTARVEYYPEPLGINGVQAYFCALFVDGGRRRQGIGKALLAKAEEITRELGYDALYLRVYDNEAEDWTIQWYERSGFTIAGEGEDYSEMRKILN